MPKVVCIHGIAQQLEGSEVLAREWVPALRDGMRAAGAGTAELPEAVDVDVAFFGDLFRAMPGTKSAGAAQSSYELADIDLGFESDLLTAWAVAAVEQDAAVGQGQKSAWAPRSIQKLAESLLQRRFFLPLADRLLVRSLKQVRLYLTDRDIRLACRSRLQAATTAETCLVIGHSLGSVVAYEVLCSMRLPRLPSFISVGSPLGLPNLIFDRLDPAPVGTLGMFPHVERWTNVAAVTDLVASVKRLDPLFDGPVIDVTIDNEAKAHDVQPYLTSAATGAAAIQALHAA